MLAKQFKPALLNLLYGQSKSRKKASNPLKVKFMTLSTEVTGQFCFVTIQ